MWKRTWSNLTDETYAFNQVYEVKVSAGAHSIFLKANEDALWAATDQFPAGKIFNGTEQMWFWPMRSALIAKSEIDYQALMSSKMEYDTYSSCWTVRMHRFDELGPNEHDIAEGLTESEEAPYHTASASLKAEYVEIASGINSFTCEVTANNTGSDRCIVMEVMNCYHGYPQELMTAYDRRLVIVLKQAAR